MMILTYCPSLLNLEAIAANLSHYIPFHPELSPIYRVSSSLISFYRIHGHPLIPRTAFPIIDKHLPHFHLALNPSYFVSHIIESEAFSSSSPLPLVFPPPCFVPSPLRQPSPATPPPTPYEPLCFMTYSLTQPLYRGPPNLSNPLTANLLCTLFPASPTSPPFTKAPAPASTHHQNLRICSSRRLGMRNWPGKTASMTSALSNPKKRLSFSSKLWVLNSQIHHQLLLSLNSTSGDNGQRRKKGYRELINLFSSINPELLYPSDLSTKATAVTGRSPDRRSPKLAAAAPTNLA
ncbi:hypothetical protein AMTRI_Chr09g36390 [Amborella trichopoda]